MSFDYIQFNQQVTGTIFDYLSDCGIAHNDATGGFQPEHMQTLKLTKSLAFRYSMADGDSGKIIFMGPMTLLMTVHRVEKEVGYKLFS